jgi:3-dehydroquinate synthetase
MSEEPEAPLGAGAARPTRIAFKAGAASTELVLGSGLLHEACDLLGGFGGRRLLLVSDVRVAPLYAVPLRERLRGGGFDAELLIMPEGEGAKSLETLADLYAGCQSLGVERDDVVIAVGGGVVGDVAGMLAGTYLRGLDFVQVPTSLVSMVSASLGGKVGLNFGGYKNQLGLFKHPALVLADVATLRTLPEVEFLSGMGELTTVGVLGAPEIFEALEADAAADLSPLISAALRYKAEVVAADPEDRLGIRARLNLGHTFGHALEELSDHTLAHGLAVAVGLCVATRLASGLGICPSALYERVRGLLTKLGLPTSLKGYAPDEVVKIMRGDKKRAGGRLRFVLPRALGDVVIVGEEEVRPALLEKTLRELLWEGADGGAPFDDAPGAGPAARVRPS